MTLPNLFGILMLRKEMRETVDKYWTISMLNMGLERFPTA